MYPFHKMKVGDSFFIPCSPTTQAKYGARVSNAGANYKKRYNSKFKSAYRKVTGGIRVWRVRCTNDKQVNVDKLPADMVLVGSVN